MYNDSINVAHLDDNTTNISKMDGDELNELIKEIYLSHFKEEQLDKIEDKIDKKELSAKAKKLALREAMKIDLIQDQQVGEEELVQLAQARSQVIFDYLVSKKIAKERLSQEQVFDIELNKEENEYIPSKLELGAK